MQILLTNDDGFHAPGLNALQRVAAELGETVTVAPAAEASGCGHSVTQRRPLQLDEVEPGRFLIDGTPADCVRVGLTTLAPQSDWVFAGINKGGNLGVDIHMSGTAAAAREAALMGKPAIAISQFRRTAGDVPWQVACEWTAAVVAELSPRPLPAGCYWNVNLPDAVDVSDSPDIVFCPLDPGHLPVAFEETPDGLIYRGRYQDRPRTAGSDVDVCFSGKIAVSRVDWPVSPIV
jgi:5'-nucleotidase